MQPRESPQHIANIMQDMGPGHSITVFFHDTCDENHSFKLSPKTLAMSTTCNKNAHIAALEAFSKRKQKTQATHRKLAKEKDSNVSHERSSHPQVQLGWPLGLLGSTLPPPPHSTKTTSNNDVCSSALVWI